MTIQSLTRNVCGLGLVLCATIFMCRALCAEEKSEWTPPKPSQEHKILKQEAGEWDAVVKVWEKPDSEPMESKGTESNKMLGDFWVISEFNGEFAGMPFTGAGAFGFDPVKKKFVGVWIDSMSPHQMTFTGDYDPGTKTMTHMGEGYDLMAGKPCQTKMITRFTDDDNRVMEMHKEEGGGKFRKTMEIKYTRRS